MGIAGWAIDLLFGTTYGLALTGIALIAAIPYGIWQGMKRLWAARPGGNHGNKGTG